MGPSDRRPFRAGGIMVASREARPDTKRRERSGSRDIWPRPLRALSTALIGAEEAESEWYQWLELKKPVDWEPHTSIAEPILVEVDNIAAKVRVVGERIPR